MNNNENPISSKKTDSIKMPDIAKENCAHFRGTMFRFLFITKANWLEKIAKPESKHSRLEDTLNLYHATKEIKDFLSLILQDKLWLEDPSEDNDIDHRIKFAKKDEVLLVLKAISEVFSTMENMIEEALA